MNCSPAFAPCCAALQGGPSRVYEHKGVCINPRHTRGHGEWRACRAVGTRMGGAGAADRTARAWCCRGQQLEDKLYGWGDEVSSNAVEVYIHGLRKKLGRRSWC